MKRRLRMKTDQATEEESNRSSIVRLVGLAPGIHLREVERALGISLTTVRYHVQLLSSSGLISCVTDGTYVRLYPAGTEQEEMRLYSRLRSRTARKILATLLQSPHITNKEISNITGLAKSTVSEHIQTFVQNNIVNVSENRWVSPKLSLANPDLIRKILNRGGSMENSGVVQRFVDLWDF